MSSTDFLNNFSEKLTRDYMSLSSFNFFIITVMPLKRHIGSTLHEY